jgi:hypothetical protein
MKKFLSISLAIIACLCLFVGTERQALAYVDPGSGLLIIQSIGSALAAAAYFMRRKIAALFRSKERSAATPVAVSADSDRKAA